MPREVAEKSHRSFFTKPWLPPLLLGIWPILFLYAESMESVPWTHILRPTAISLALTVLLLGAFSLGASPAARAPRLFMLSGLIMWFYSYGYFQAAFALRQRYLLAAYCLLLGLFLGAIWQLTRRKVNWELATRSLNIFAFSLWLFTGGRIGVYQLMGLYERRHEVTPVPSEAAVFAQAASLRRGYCPDIYYIIVDSYTRSDILQKKWRIDNTEFIAGLQKRGFKIATQSYANYSFTRYSVASALNMDYIHRSGIWSLAPLLSRNYVCRFLKARGYVSVVFPSFWTAVDFLPADYHFSPRLKISAFESVLLQMSFWNAVTFLRSKIVRAPRIKRTTLQYQNIRAATLYTLTHLGRVSSLVADKRPKFVFVHLWPPHYPFIFGPQGEDLAATAAGPPSHNSPAQFVTGYRNQITFISKRLLQLIDEILASSPRPPIIIVQGDHGARETWLIKKTSEATAADWEDMFPILCALYLPGDAASRVPENITPVNIFRLIFNYYFGTSFPLLPEYCYLRHISPSGLRFVFTRVQPPPAEPAQPLPPLQKQGGLK